MFFLPLTDPATWAAGLPGSPVLGSPDGPGAVTVFLIPVGRWTAGPVGRLPPATSTDADRLTADRRRPICARHSFSINPDALPDRTDPGERAA